MQPVPAILKPLMVGGMPLPPSPYLAQNGYLKLPNGDITVDGLVTAGPAVGGEVVMYDDSTSSLTLAADSDTILTIDSADTIDWTDSTTTFTLPSYEHNYSIVFEDGAMVLYLDNSEVARFDSDGDLILKHNLYANLITSTSIGPPQLSLGSLTLEPCGSTLCINGKPIGDQTMTTFGLLSNLSFVLAVVIITIFTMKVIVPRISIKWLAKKFYHLIFKPAKKAQQDIEDTFRKEKYK